MTLWSHSGSFGEGAGIERRARATGAIRRYRNRRRAKIEQFGVTTRVVMKIFAGLMSRWTMPQVLHHDEGKAVLRADPIDGAEMGMVEGGRGAGFAAKALERLGSLAVAAGRNFRVTRRPSSMSSAL